MPRLFVRSRRSGFNLLACLLVLHASALTAADPDCVPLERIDIGESRLFTEKQQRARLDGLLGSCIDAGLIRRVLAEVSNHYIDQGYVTTRPYLLEQDISDGQIEIRVLLGTIEAIVDADSGHTNRSIASAFAFDDEILNLRDLETALEAIERVRSVSAEFEIKPGSATGSSIVEITRRTSVPLQIELGVNAQTGLDAQGSLRATLDNPFNINDILELRYNSGRLRESYQSNRSGELDYSFALGGYLVELSHSDISYQQRVQGINETYLSEGETVSDAIRVGKVLARDRSNRVTLALSLSVKDSRSFFEDQLIDVSSYRTSQVLLELGHDWTGERGRVITRYRFHRGLDSFGARDDDYFTPEAGFDSEARLQFDKFVIDTRWDYAFDKSDWSTMLNLHLQYSDDVLFDSDRLSLGSPYTVRGYSSALSGSNAGYLRHDFSRNLRSLVNPFSGNPLTKAISMSFGIDYGEASCDSENRGLCGDIYGVGVAVGLSDPNFYGRLSWGHPLKQFGDDIGDRDRYLLDLRWVF